VIDAAWLDQRIEWLTKEARSGGDFKNLTARIDEATYIRTKILPALEQAKGLAEALRKLIDCAKEMDSNLHGEFGVGPYTEDPEIEQARAALARYEEVSK
jgi:hypothetical protein